MPMLLSLTLALCPALQSSADGATSALIDLRSAAPARLVRALELEGFDVEGAEISPRGVRLVVTAEERALLVARGLDVQLVEQGRPLRDILAERAVGDGVVPNGYLDLAGILAELNNYASAHPTLAEVVDLTTRFNAPPTHEGRHIFGLRISDNVAVDEDEPAFLLVAAHHCREIVTPVIALDTIEHLLTEYATSAAIQGLVDGHELWIVPVWNPDGYNHVFLVDNLWRKNRRPVGNNFGVDLNRNYPFQWSSACGGSTSTSSSTYRGPAPASEAETQTMLALSADRHFEKVLDYHSSGRETLWGYACPSTPIDAYWRSEATLLSSASGYGGAERAPSADGEHYQWQFSETGAMAFLTETHTTFQPTFVSAEAEAALVWPGTLHLMGRPMPITGHVRDACSGAPLAATITYINPVFTAGETNHSNARFGRYHAFLPPGSHTLRFEASGYVAATRVIAVSAGATTTLDVALDRISGGATVFCAGAPSSSGVAPTIAIVGSTSVAANQFSVQGGGLPSQQPVALLHGQNLVQIPAYGGLLCVGRPARRSAVHQADLLGSVNVPLDLTLAQIGAGVTWGFQLYYRDPAAGGSQLNFTAALALVFCP